MSRIVFGVIGLDSYAAPLEGSTDPIEVRTGPGTAYFFPPFIDSQFSGVHDRARGVIDALRAGGAPASLVADASVTSAIGGAALITTIAALETAGWSIDQFAHGDAAGIAARAAREALVVTEAHLGVEAPPVAPLLRGFVLGAVLRIARAFAPVDLESFFRVHFGKVSSQTRGMLDEWSELAQKHSTDHEAIDSLRQRLQRSGR
jgi:hypothetical protein